MKLFVWTNFSPDYSGGLAFAIAKDEADAKKLIEADRGCTIYNWGTLEVRRLDRRTAKSVSGGA